MAYSTVRTFYDVLDVSKSASRNEIKDAYKKMALKHHPDKNPAKRQAVSNFQEVQEAYETLYDDRKRKYYNIQMGLKTSLSTRPGFSTGFAGYPTTATPKYPPQAPRRPDAFWSDFPKAEPTQGSPRFTVFEEEDWGKPNEWTGTYQEPDQDWYNEWDNGHEKRMKDFEEFLAQREELRKKQTQEREAADLLNQRKQAEAKLPSTLAATLSKILRILRETQEMEAENKAADTVIEDWIGMDDKELRFFEKVYKRNIQLNALRRDLETAMKKYKKLGKMMKDLDPKQGDEAEKIYRKLQKKTQPAQEAKTQDTRRYDDQERQAKKQRRRQPEDDHLQDGAGEMTNEKNSKDTDKSGKEADDEDERLRKENPSSSDQAYTHHDEVIHTPTTSDYHALDYEADESANEFQPDEEVILYQCRVLHAQHLDVRNELWEIAEGAHMCCYCGNIQTVFECPRYEQCALRACEGCRRAPVGNR